jgi:hypothetical protein
MSSLTQKMQFNWLTYKKFIDFKDSCWNVVFTSREFICNFNIRECNKGGQPIEIEQNKK